MKLLLRRSQKSGMLGGQTFVLDVRAELTPEERQNIDKYGLANTLLYSHEAETAGAGFIGWVATELSALSVTVGDLTKGKRIDCKSILQMLGAEQQIKEAARNFKHVLDAASQFGGEEVVTL